MARSTFAPASTFLAFVVLGCGSGVRVQPLPAPFVTPAYTPISGISNVVVLSDSRAICDEAVCNTGPIQGYRWPDILRNYLQDAYGGHGTGLVPLIHVVGYPHVNADNWTIDGSWSATGTANLMQGVGPSQGSNMPGGGVVLMADGTAASFSSSMAYDHLRTYCATSAASGSLSITIDGRPAGSACTQTTATATATVVTSPALALGTHTATLTCTGSCQLYGAEGTAGSFGVSVHNVAVGAATAEFFGSVPPLQAGFTDVIPGGTQVAIIDLLTNDPWVGYDVADYTRVMTLLIQHEQAIGAEVLVVVAPISNIQDAAELPTYTAALLEVASSLNVPVVNIQSTWGTTYNPNSGFWSPDGIHPNSLGCINEFQLIQPAVHI